MGLRIAAAQTDQFPLRMQIRILRVYRQRHSIRLIEVTIDGRIDTEPEQLFGRQQTMFLPREFTRPGHAGLAYELTWKED